jgi:N-acetylmuramoyl-L-alanine amidase
MILCAVHLRFFHPAVAAMLAFSVALTAAQPPPSAPYSVVSRTGRQSLAVHVVNGQEMFALDDLARLFGLTVREDTLAGGITVSANNQTIVMTSQQPLASIGGRMISLPAAPVREGRSWLVPVDFVARALAPISQQRIELRKPSRLLLVGDVRLPRVAARGEALGAVTRVTIDVAPATPHTLAQEGTRLLLRFDADGLDVGDVRIAPNDVLRSIHIGDSPSVLAFELGPRFASFRMSDQPSPASGAGRIVVDLMAQTEAVPGGSPTTTPPQPAQPGQPEPPLLDLPTPGGLRTIVIDPGHGGDDAGAKGAGGTLEKNVTLGVARKLKAALESRLGVRVMLPRDGDQNISVDQRAALANNNKADLFLSIHASASVRPAASGVEVFSLAGSDDSPHGNQAAPESLPVLGGGSRDIQVIPWETAQGRFLDQSASLARTLATALRERVTMSQRPLLQAPLRVLVGANMPAALVETGFLTNAAQEKQLAGDEYQNAVVAALVEAIVRFRSGAGAPR